MIGPNTDIKAWERASGMLSLPPNSAGDITQLRGCIVKTILALFVLVALAPSASARSPVASLAIPCPATLPTQQEVSTVLGITNFSQTYAARERVMHYAQKACKRGSGSVRVVAGDGSIRPSPSALELTAITQP